MGIYDASSPDLSGPPTDVPTAGSSPEAGVIYDAVDTPVSPNAPAPPLDGAVSPNTPEAGGTCDNGCDDGLSCTTDTCVAGVCQSTLNPGYCLIDKACYMNGDSKPGDACQACTTATSTALWTPEPEGAGCGTGATCDASTNECRADGAIDISGGDNTVCALFRSGSVRCWGANGPMVGASTGSNVAAQPIAGLEDAISLSVGGGIACAVRATGTVFCWGSALAGGGVLIPGITNATQVSAGPHTCVRTADSKVLCWGSNSVGELGLGTTSTTAISTPLEMSGVTDAQSVAACGGATCILRKGGQVSCTGSSPDNGQPSRTLTAVDLPAASAAVSLSCSTWSPGLGGSVGSFWAVTKNGTVLTWGGSQAVPGDALGVGQVLSATWTTNVGCCSSYLAIQQDHTLWSGGDNSSGQLGDGTFTAAAVRTIPRLIHDASSVSNVVAVTAASVVDRGVATCLLRTDGSISCAGQNGDPGGTALADGQQYPQAPRAYFVPVVGILPVASEDGQCYDGVDNDGDGKADLDDPDCAQDLGSATGQPVATVPFTGVFGNYLRESCNGISGSYGGPEAVLTWTAPSGGTYQFDTDGSTFDTVFAVYKGNPLTGCTEVACNDDDPTLSNGASAAKVQVATGDKLTLVVDSKVAQSASTTPASFVLNLTKL